MRLVEITPFFCLSIHLLFLSFEVPYAHIKYKRECLFCGAPKSATSLHPIQLYSIAISKLMFWENNHGRLSRRRSGPDISGSKKATKDGGIATCALQFASVEKALLEAQEAWICGRWTVIFQLGDPLPPEFMRSMFYSWGGSLSKSKEAIVDEYLGLIGSGGYTQKVIQSIAPKLVAPQ